MPFTTKTFNNAVAATKKCGLKLDIIEDKKKLLPVLKSADKMVGEIEDCNDQKKKIKLKADLKAELGKVRARAAAYTVEFVEASKKYSKLPALPETIKKAFDEGDRIFVFFAADMTDEADNITRRFSLK